MLVDRRINQDMSLQMNMDMKGDPFHERRFLYKGVFGVGFHVNL